MALSKEQIAQRIAKEVKDGYYVNLGIGIPTLVANFVRDDISVEFQSENGVLACTRANSQVLHSCLSRPTLKRSSLGSHGCFGRR